MNELKEILSDIVADLERITTAVYELQQSATVDQLKARLAKETVSRKVRQIYSPLRTKIDALP